MGTDADVHAIAAIRRRLGGARSRYVTGGSRRFPKETLDVSGDGRTGAAGQLPAGHRLGRQGQDAGTACSTGQDKGQKAQVERFVDAVRTGSADADRAGLAGRDDSRDAGGASASLASGSRCRCEPSRRWAGTSGGCGRCRRRRSSTARVDVAPANSVAHRARSVPAMSCAAAPEPVERDSRVPMAARAAASGTGSRPGPRPPRAQRGRPGAGGRVARCSASPAPTAPTPTGSSTRSPGGGHQTEELAFRIHHRDESETGNIKQIWELSRHHHLTVLASAWWLTERRAVRRGRRPLSCGPGGAANPFLTGVHWTSGIEIGVRLIALGLDPTAAGRLAEGRRPVRAQRRRGPADRLAPGVPGRLPQPRHPRRTTTSSPRRPACSCGACAFPWFAESDSWRDQASALLQRELAANTFPDGINRELATDYHRFVLELGLVAAVEADAAGRPLSAETWQLLTRMLDAGAGRRRRRAAARRGRTTVTRAGRSSSTTRSSIRGPSRSAPGSALLGAARLGRRLAGGVGPGRAVLGAIGRPRPDGPGDSPAADLPRRRAWSLLRSRPTDGPEIWCRCDGGPHGFLSIAAHAHADALSIEVRHDGVDILADPGTYCYHGEPAWRDWFRSTAAHNTLEVAGVDQAESGGPFLWTTTVHSTTLAAEVGDRPRQVWTAEHDGYRRLATPTTHRRSVILDSVSRRLVVQDSLDADQPVPVTLAWQLGPAVEVSLAEGVAELSWPTENGVARGRLPCPAASTGLRTGASSTRSSAGTPPGSAARSRPGRCSGVALPTRQPPWSPR